MFKQTFYMRFYTYIMQLILLKIYSTEKNTYIYNIDIFIQLCKRSCMFMLFCYTLRDVNIA